MYDLHVINKGPKEVPVFHRSFMQKLFSSPKTEHFQNVLYYSVNRKNWKFDQKDKDAKLFFFHPEITSKVNAKKQIHVHDLKCKEKNAKEHVGFDFTLNYISKK